DEEEVSDDDKEIRVQVLMALADGELLVGKNHARNAEWIDITMKKVNILLSMDEDSNWQSYLKYIHIDLKYVEEKRLNLLSSYTSFEIRWWRWMVSVMAMVVGGDDDGGDVVMKGGDEVMVVVIAAADGGDRGGGVRGHDVGLAVAVGVDEGCRNLARKWEERDCVLRRLGSIFNSVYAAVQKLKKDSWKELQFSLVDNCKLNVVYLLNRS
ncbi:hypothetical protein Tco_0880755, partial [Tanacetum coccineum]